MLGALNMRNTPANRTNWLRRFVGAALFFTFCGAAFTTRAELQFDVFLGYDWIVPEASWFPIVCEIKNDGPPFIGVIEVTPGSYGTKGQSHQVAVELPTGTLKRIVIPAFSPSRYTMSWDVRLLDERGRLREERTSQRPRRQIAYDTPLMGSLARTVSGAPVLRPTQRDQAESQPAAARLQPELFPDNPLVLEGMGTLYLNSEVASKLSVGQVNALEAWLYGGGHLIVGLEQVADVAASPWMRGLMPCTPTEFQTVRAHPELENWLRDASSPTNYTENLPYSPGRGSSRGRTSTARPGVGPDRPFADMADDPAFELADLQVLSAATPLPPDAHVVVSAGGTPLIVRANRGEGKVTLLLFSPEREPFKSWKNLQTFWSKLAEVPGNLYVSSDTYGGYGQSADGIFGAMIDSRQVHKLPYVWLLLLLLVYLVVIGPFDQFWLKRIRKPMLTWITFPCYVVAFSLLIYFIGYKLRAGDTEWNELHVVDVLRQGDHSQLHGRTYVSIYSPANARYAVSGPQPYATLRGEFAGVTGGQGGERVAVSQNGDSYKADLFVPVWTSQLYVSDWWQPAALPLNVSVVPQGGGWWQVTVQNQTDHPLTQSQLVIQGRIMPLGEVPARQSKTFSVGATQGQMLRDFVQRYGGQFGSAVQERQSAFGRTGGGQIGDWPDASMAASFIGYLGRSQNYNMNFIVPAGLDLARVADRGNAVLLAWAPDYSPAKPMRQFTTLRSSRQTLWRVAVEIKN